MINIKSVREDRKEPLLSYANIDDLADNCSVEFTIFPRYRKKGYASRAIDKPIKLRPGKWQLTYSVKNTATAIFGHKIKLRYAAGERLLGNSERVLCFKST